MGSPRRSSSNGDEEDDYDQIPLQHQRPFGTGLFRKPIAFVSASAGAQQLKSVDDTAAATPRQDVADIYLSMVLPEDATRSRSAPPTSNNNSSSSTTTTTKTAGDESSQPSTCPVCRLPLDTDPETHQQTLAHQVCLPHSQPPSALDRTRMGLAYLSAYGWDPDSRRGLGVEQQGIRYPVKAKVKDDNLGIGMRAPSPPPPPGEKQREEEKKKKKAQLLDAKKVRKMALDDRKKAARIRQDLFGDGRLEKYLGPGAAG
ncbi:hypothetical protein MYCTH_2107979 [Thermothelomyces thermophilus ATCC 42464]|uniref:G-patch domain-containing protein n=1 Tax=Thermothelomyces thermophilus (strain ATCC 42464 / BCRC 31852 / DSM 1799) TaxID=573729 RepID=G2Q4D8_THET4|nr:uncharacterized protein MYCTH_2107979 [Thermothelomyces thermophilus ATCC 42464]AEO55333.1 hypothetical protein MYCTH_2107979 [Thermothelomyces thermophilus ATCC 42464]